MEFIQPQNVQEALRAFQKWGKKGMGVAGGTNLLPDLRAKKVSPGALIDLSRIESLSFIEAEGDEIRIGALTPIAEIAASKILQRKAPILCEAARKLGNPLVRNRATLGGNLAKASPAADTAVPLLALDACVEVQGAGSRKRRIPVDQFLRGPNQNALKPGELIRDIFFPPPKPGTKMAYRKMGLRNAMAISLVSLAVLLEISKGTCRQIRIAFGAVAPRPIRAYQTENILRGKEITPELLQACGNQAEKEISPITDIRGGAEYRRAMAATLLRRALGEALEMSP
ncbi:MAG: xanthine dehydrogenase family protein subunit M [Syntrophaceae bacterium]|nr:xanthine dehydrogenase family protein subunit M [Syntrophaceae bacterium]